MAAVRDPRGGITASISASAIGLLLLTVALVLVGSGTAAEGDKSADRLVNASASGRIAVVPDIARISAGVMTEADTTREALIPPTDLRDTLCDPGVGAQGAEA